MITNDEGEELFVTPIVGRVIDNEDPKGMARIQVHVQGLFDNEDDGSPWCRPIGIAGDNSGYWNIPPVGTQVLLLFVAGDPDNPWYVRAQPTTGQLPEYVKKVIEETPAEQVGEVTAQVRVMETRDWDIVIDERPGRRLFRIRAKGLGSEDPDGSSLMIEMDREAGVLALSAPVGIALNTGGRVAIVAPDIQIGGRSVTQGIVKGL